MQAGLLFASTLLSVVLSLQLSPHRISAPRLRTRVSMAARPILVVGSVNADLIVQVDRLPVPGETLKGGGGQVLPGGKGANQAVAASRLGAPVKFCGVFGSDSFGTMLRSTMTTSGADISLSFTSEGPTGQAVILLQAGGENSIVLIPGANADWPKGWQDTLLPAVAEAGLVMLQREIPDEVNVAVAKHAKAHGVPVLLDLGGDDRPPPADLIPNVDFLCPNESELQRFTGAPTSTEAEIAAAVARAQDMGVGAVLVTIGAEGSLLFPTRGADGAKPPLRQKCFPVHTVVDTTGAGDCFRGAFAVALAQKQPPEEALRLGAAAAAHCISVLGAMSSMPTKDQVSAILARGTP